MSRESSGKNIEKIAFCGHCISMEIPPPKPTKFKIRKLIEAFVEGRPTVFCNEKPLSIELLAPDISFSHLPIIRDLEVEEKIGEGSFGKIYKAGLQSFFLFLSSLSISKKKSLEEAFGVDFGEWLSGI